MRLCFSPPDSALMRLCVQRNETRMSEDIRRLKQEKQALEVDLQLMKKERELAKAQATSASGKKYRIRRSSNLSEDGGLFMHSVTIRRAGRCASR